MNECEYIVAYKIATGLTTLQEIRRRPIAGPVFCRLPKTSSRRRRQTSNAASSCRRVGFEGSRKWVSTCSCSWVLTRRSSNFVIRSLARSRWSFSGMLAASAIYKMKSNGPRTDPWGTPYGTWQLGDCLSRIWTDWCLLDRYEMNQFNALPLSGDAENARNENARHENARHDNGGKIMREK